MAERAIPSPAKCVSVVGVCGDPPTADLRQTDTEYLGFTTQRGALPWLHLGR
jgi:hypothetical protein